MKHTLKSVRSLAVILITFGSLAGGANGAIIFNFTDEVGGLTLTSSGTYNLTGATAITPTYGSTGAGAAGLANGSFDLIGFGTDTPTATDTAYALTFVSGSLGGFSSNLGFNLSTATTAPSQAFYFLDEGLFQIVFNGLSITGDASGSAVWSGRTIANALLVDGYLATYQINGTSETLTISVNGGAIPEPSSALLLGLAGLTFLTRRHRRV